MGDFFLRSRGQFDKRRLIADDDVEGAETVDSATMSPPRAAGYGAVTGLKGGSF